MMGMMRVSGGVVGVGTGGATGVLGSIVVVRWFTSNRGFVIGVLSNASACAMRRWTTVASFRDRAAVPRCLSLNGPGARSP